jgi:hypothetical protein
MGVVLITNSALENTGTYGVVGVDAYARRATLIAPRRAHRDAIL